MSTLWSGRFGEQPDVDVFQFQASFRFDRRLFAEDVTGSIAWAEALATAGVLTPADARAIISSLEDILRQGRDNPAFLEGSDEDVHAFVERQLISRVGDLGRRLHTGRSRNEQVSLDTRLYLMRRIPSIQAVIEGLVAALADRAEAAADALMPAYTHLRRAQPVLVSHFFLAHTAALRRDHHRFLEAYAEADAMPLGSGAVAGTNYAVDTAALARRLSFSRVVTNSLDATADRDFVAVFLHACALTMVHLSRMAEDLILFTSEEFGYFELADTVSTGSSLMPQKKNPDPLELIRGKAGRTIGDLTGWLSTMKGIPSGYNKDLQEDKEALFDAEDTTVGCLAAATKVVSTLGLNRERVFQAASGLLMATDVADYLVARGMPFRRAHELVGGLVRSLVASGRDFASLSSAEWRAASDLFDDRVLEVITPAASVRAKATPQSTNATAVSAAQAEVRSWLAKSAKAEKL